MPDLPQKTPAWLVLLAVGVLAWLCAGMPDWSSVLPSEAPAQSISTPNYERDGDATHG